MALGLAVLALMIFAAGALSARLQHWSITMAMVFVGVGLVLGPAVTGLLAISAEAEAMKALTELTLGLLLFADASTLNWQQVRHDARLPVRLLLIGLPLTVILGVVTARLVLPAYDWALAALLATILAPTDAALGLPIFENVKVPVRIRRALNVESGLNDGLATPLVALAVAFAAASSGEGHGNWLISALREIGIGVAVGAAVGAGGAELLSWSRRRGWSDQEPVRLAVLGLAGLAFFLARALSGNGFISAFIGGIAFAARRREAATDAEQTEQLGTVLSLLVWTFFGAVMVPLAAKLTTDWRPVAYAVASLTVIRMLPVAIALTGTRLRTDTVILMGWLGPRGLASVVFTLLAFVELQAAGALDATLLATATWTILLSVLLHGVTAGPLAGWYARRLAAAGGTPVELEEMPELRRRRAALG